MCPRATSPSGPLQKPARRNRSKIEERTTLLTRSNVRLPRLS